MQQITNMFLFMTKSQVVYPYWEKVDKCCRLDPRGCYWPRGKMLGGSSGIGFTLCLRANRQNYGNWGHLAPGWDYDHVLPYFLKAEGNTDASLVAANPWLHNAYGPSKVETGVMNELQTALWEATKASGMLITPDHNLPDSRGYGRIQTGTAYGKRYATARAYLALAKNRPNLHVIKHAFIRKIIFEGKTAVGIEYKYKNKIGRMYARKEVILGAGAFGSAGLLLRSGVGPAAELKKNKIEPVCDLPVGKNFIEHRYALFF